MTVLHTIDRMDASSGGTSEAVRSVCDHLAGAGVDVEIVTHASGPSTPVLRPRHPRASLTAVTEPVWGSRALAFRRTLSRVVDAHRPRIVHDNGLWLSTNVLSALEALRRDLPLVVTPHGMLHPSALQHRSWKKKLAWWAYQYRVVESASVIHATSPDEARHLRKRGLTPPIAVVPNGVPIPDTWKQSPSPGDRRTALFLSRIHPLKGLPNLIDAWARVQPDGWELVIAGPSEAGHRAEVEARVRERGLEDRVRFIGAVDASDKWDLYRASDLFVLPTYSENFGIVVAEALACGLPVITTTGAPWEVLDETDTGWWVEPAVEPIAGALAEATSCSDDRLLAMGARGRDVVEERFTWNQVARDLRSVYRWLLGEQSRPDCVDVA